MRIGTWNLAGRWTVAHRDLLLSQDCDVWLLTEVREDVDLGGYQGHLTEGTMASARRWAGVFSRRPLTPIPDPHPATAAAVIEGITYGSSVLPWRGCGTQEQWTGATHNVRMAATLEQLRHRLPRRDLVWGGDWNQGLVGREYVGSRSGRAELLNLLDELSLVVPTAHLPHRMEGVTSIDHVAIGKDRVVETGFRCEAPRLSDHDLYVVVVN